MRADDVDVGQELDVEDDLAGAVAVPAAQRAGVVGEVAGLEARLPGIRDPRVDAAQLVHDPGVGGHGRAHIRADGSGIHDELRDRKSVV